MIIAFIVFTVLSAHIDAEAYNDGYRFTDHASRYLLRWVVVTMVAHNIVEFGLYASLFYLIFDYTLNLMCNRPILYIGQTSWIDKQWKGAKYIQLIFKVTLFITFLILYYVKK